jgi:hypothetical protein
VMKMPLADRARLALEHPLAARTGLLLVTRHAGLLCRSWLSYPCLMQAGQEMLTVFGFL